ncbi:MAG: ShlB/FhaC/HecB family hemolysin secretion/activation protein [Pseudomonadota bacterium]
MTFRNWDRLFFARARPLTLIGAILAAPGNSHAVPIDLPDFVRPGAVRPSGASQAIADRLAPPRNQLLADAVGAPAFARPGAIRPGGDTRLEDSFPRPLFAGVVDLPDAARPGAIRPGDNSKLVPPQPVGEVFAVPPVIDRPLEIDGGEKVVVTAFKLDGVVDRAAFDITTDEVQSLVDAQIGKFPEGFSVNRLQEVADSVTGFYRDKGLILAQAFVPVQDVVDGVVTLQVFEGALGRVVVEGNEMFNSETIERPFRNLLGEPVTKETIESALLQVADIPGQSSFGVFRPGVDVGTADMVVKVDKEKRFDLAIRADNHGISETGKNRYLVQVAVNDLTGVGDRLVGTGQHTEVPANSFFWGFEYQRPFYFDTMVGASVNQNQFDVGGAFAAAEIATDTRTQDLWISRPFIRSRTQNLSARFGLTRKRSGTKAGGRRVTLDALTALYLQMNWDNVDARFAGINAATLEVAHGFNNVFGAINEDPASIPPSRQTDNAFATGQYDKVFFNYSRFQALTPVWDKLIHHNLLFNFELQYSPDLLLPLEQYAIGGPNNVRGYRPTEGLFDRAAFGSVEWIINAPFIADQPAFGNRTWGELYQFSVFFDLGAGKLNGTLGSEVGSENFKSVGFALSFNNPNKFSTKLTVASPIGDPDPVNERDPTYWLDLNFFF